MRNILFGVGPTRLNPAIRKAMDMPVDLCQSAVSRKLVMGLEEKLNCFFGKGRHSFAIPGSGSAGMEACLLNVVEPGDTVVVGVAGIFGHRIAEMASILGAEVIIVEAEKGDAVPLEEIERILRIKPVKLVCLVHLETSTGVLQPMEQCVNMVKHYGAFFMLDVVASFAGITLDLDRWGVDIAYASTQKCLSCPSGLALISLNDFLWNYLKEREKKPRSWYFDFISIYEHTTRGTYPYTTPVLLIRFLSIALEYILQTGIKRYLCDQKECGSIVEAIMQTHGFVLFPRKEIASPYVKVFRTDMVADAMWLKTVLETEYGVQIASGIGTQKHSLVRIGTMGISANYADVEVFQKGLVSLLSTI